MGGTTVFLISCHIKKGQSTGMLPSVAVPPQFAQETFTGTER